MNRRRYLLVGMCAIAGAGAGCSTRFLPTDTTETTESPPLTPSETGTATPTDTPTATQSPTHTPAGPFTFASIVNYDDIVHQFTFSITAIETHSTVFERSGKVSPAPENAVQFSDKWLNEPGTYRVRCRIAAGGETIVEVEVDEMWACDNTVVVDINDNGRVTNAVLHGDGQRC